jgi:hypothetical protein
MYLKVGPWVDGLAGALSTRRCLVMKGSRGGHFAEQVIKRFLIIVILTSFARKG